MKIFLIVLSIVLLLVGLISPKTRVFTIFKDHFKTFYNAENKKFYWFDFIVFIGVPIGISFILTFFKLDITDYTNTLITVHSIMAGLLFNFLVLILGIDTKNKNDTYKIVLKEAYSNVSYEILISILSVILLCVYDFINLIWLQTILIIIIMSLSINFILTVLMILKRVYLLFSKRDE